MLDDLARQKQIRRIGPDANELFVGGEQRRQVLPGLDRAHEQDRTDGARGVARSEVRGGPWPAHDQPVGADAEARRDRAGGIARVHDDEIRARRMGRGQRRVVAADFGARPAGMVEEVEIVDRDRLGGGAGRHQERMERVGDVGGSGDHLDRRPFQAVPGEVERLDRNARVHVGGTRDPIGLEPVLPRAREQDEAVGREQLALEGGRQLVHILADAGAFPKRGPIIDQDPHARGIVPQWTGHPGGTPTPCSSIA